MNYIKLSCDLCGTHSKILLLSICYLLFDSYGIMQHVEGIAVRLDAIYLSCVFGANLEESEVVQSTNNHVFAG